MIETRELQKLDVEGVRTLVKWAAEEGWNPGRYDADVFWAADHDGYYGYILEGKLIAGGAVVSYDGLFGFMGLFIVRPDYRGIGLGHKLWYQRRDILLSRLRPGASIGMDGVVDMQPFYSKGGFAIAFRDERYAIMGALYEMDQHIRPIGDEDVQRVLVYDEQCFGFARPRFMIPWLGQQGIRAFQYILDGLLKGFVVMRKAQTGYKICPLFADDPAVAEALLRACLNEAGEETVYIDIPVINTDAVDLMGKYNGTYVFECGRMYYGDPPPIPIRKIFGITSFELG